MRMGSRAAGGDSSVDVKIGAACDRSLVSNVTTAWSSGLTVCVPVLTPTLLHRRLMHPLPWWFSRRNRIMSCSSALSWMLHYLLILLNILYMRTNNGTILYHIEYGASRIEKRKRKNCKTFQNRSNNRNLSPLFVE